MFSIRNLSCLVLTLTLAACASMDNSTKAEKQRAVLAMKDTALTQLYAKKPDARGEISSAPGYAVFSNANVNLILLAAGTGHGVVKKKSTGEYTYMDMAEGGLGLGLGVKDYRVVMIFHTEASMDNFVKNGWVFSGDVDASAKSGEKGGSVEGEAHYGDVTVHTFTESGLALQASVKGTKFWKNKELN